MPISEARKRANQKYIDKQGEIKVRVSRERKEEIQAHAEAQGESVNGFIGRAIVETMGRDGAGEPQETGAVFIPSDTLKAAQAAAETAGESLPEFIARLVSEAVERDTP